MLALTTPDTAVLIDYMYVSPAAWGRYRGLPVRKDIADAMLGGGPSGLAMNVLRLGWSMCNAPGYLWKHFRGPRWLRPPYAGTWYRYASGGWRIFEFLDLCEAAHIECVVTLNSDESPSDAADLIEYAHGSADTKWGAVRVADGQHVAPYRPFTIEIGNEQPLSSHFVGQVANLSNAMDARATALRLPLALHFAIGHNFAMLDVQSAQTAAMVDAVRFLGDRVLWDAHVGGDYLSNALDSWNLLLAMDERFRDLGSQMKLGVFEENGYHHGLRRALGHARQNNRFQRLGTRFTIDTTANCLQAQSRNNNGWDQGAVFYLPNMTWPSPLGEASPGR